VNEKFAMLIIETETPIILRVKGEYLIKMWVSDSHNVETAADAPLERRARALQSIRPKPAAPSVSFEAEVSAETILSELIAIEEYNGNIDELRRDTALFSTDSANIWILPNEGGWMHTTEVSLRHIVAAHALTLILIWGWGFEFEKYLPISCSNAAPLEVYEVISWVPLNTGSGYEYNGAVVETRPDLVAETERLRPHPEELSVAWSPRYPGAFNDTLLSEIHSMEDADECSISNERAAETK
jgi:hypothetical protein